MKDDLRSKALHVSDRRAADVMSQPSQRHVVLSLIGRTASISELVAESRSLMSFVQQHHVTKLHRMRLLKVATRTARSGLLELKSRAQRR